MARQVLIDSVDRSSVVLTDSMRIVTAANRGEVGIGSLTIEDTTGTLDVPAWKALQVRETDAAEPRIYTGYVGGRKFSRGNLRTGTQRTIEVDSVDLNHRLDAVLIRDQDGIRDAETDHERIGWLWSSSYLSFLSVAINPNTNTKAMEPKDYRGMTALDVLNECAEASGKTFFLTWDTTNGYMLYYDLSTGTSLSSTFRISDDPADQNGTTWFPIDASRELDPSEVYSGVEVHFDKGSVFSSSAGTQSTFKQREIAIQSDKHTADGAENVAEAFLDDASVETETISCTILVDSAYVNSFPAGYRFRVKLRHLGVTSFTYYRVIRCTIRPVPTDTTYYIDLEFAPRVKTMRARRVVTRRPALLDETIPNGGFESGPKDTDNRIADWLVSTGTARTYDAPQPQTNTEPKAWEGKRALRVMQDTAATILTEDFAPVAGEKTYLVRGYWQWRDVYGPGTPSLKVNWYRNDYVYISTFTVAWKANVHGYWSHVSAVFKAPKNAAFRKVYINSPAGTAGEFYFFDHIQFYQTDLKVGDTVPR